MTVEIVRVAAKGDGVASDGSFHPQTAPGDSIAADGTISPGPNRRETPCRHFPVCGGCDLQHLSDASYADFVRERVAGALAGQGIAGVSVKPPDISPPRSRRRCKLQIIRGKKGISIGFAERGSHMIVDLHQCEILRPELFEMIAPLRKLVAAIGPKKGSLHCDLTLTDQGVDCTLGKLDLDGLEMIETVQSFAADRRLARLSVDQGFGPEPQWEPEPVTVTLGGVPVAFPPNAFLQATAPGEAALVNIVREIVADAPVVADLFAGLGTFALSMDPATKIYAAEAARDMIGNLQTAARSSGRTLFAEHRDLFRRPLQPPELDRFSSVILDPPRAGAKEQVMQLAASQVPVIAYVSCNPSSFARDARTLVEGGYRFDSVWPVAQFLWSTHVELVGRFERP